MIWEGCDNLTFCFAQLCITQIFWLGWAVHTDPPCDYISRNIKVNKNCCHKGTDDCTNLFQAKFWPVLKKRTYLSPKKFLSKKIGLKMFNPKNLGSKIWFQENLGPKNYGTKNFYMQKNLLGKKKFWSNKFLSPKNFWVPKIFEYKKWCLLKLSPQ